MTIYNSPRNEDESEQRGWVYAYTTAGNKVFRKGGCYITFSDHPYTNHLGEFCGIYACVCGEFSFTRMKILPNGNAIVDA